jgi:hypothetical protein
MSASRRGVSECGGARLAGPGRGYFDSGLGQDEVGVEVGVERRQPGAVGRRGAKADVPVGPHQNRARGGKTGRRGSVRRLDDVYESAPAAAQALDAGIIRSAEEHEVVGRARERCAVGIAIARPRDRWSLYPGPEVLCDQRAVGVRDVEHAARPRERRQLSRGRRAAADTGPRRLGTRKSWKSQISRTRRLAKPSPGETRQLSLIVTALAPTPNPFGTGLVRDNPVSALPLAGGIPMDLVKGCSGGECGLWLGGPVLPAPVVRRR